jgi:hypothetical protein
LMTQKSLVYMVLAVAVGYILVSAVPQQIAMYTNPQEIKLTGSEFSTADGGTITVSPENDTEAIADAAQAAEAAQSAATQAPSLEVRGSGFEPSFLETSQFPELLMWWTLDVLIALVIYWVAKQRLA